MSIELPETDHHIVISADSHCGADLRGYKPYLEKKYHDDFEEWAAASEEAAKQQEALFAGRLGTLDWIEKRPLSEGESSFQDLLRNKVAAPKIVLEPWQ